jgi:hypothetical protein
MLTFAQSWVLKFDPSQAESYVDCGKLEEYSLEEFTIETWLYVDTWSGNYIFSNESWNDASGAVGFAFRFASNGQLEMNVGTGEWEAVKTDENRIRLKKWQHLAVSLNSENTLKLYIDGKLEKQATLSKSMRISGTNLFMGEGSMWQGRGLDGKLSDFRIWNLERSAEQIKTGMHSQLTGDETGLVANWLLNEGQGNSINDLNGEFNRTKGAGTSWILKNSVLVSGSLHILNQGKDSVLLSVPDEAIANWVLEEEPASGEVTFRKVDDYSAYLIYKAQTTDYHTDTLFIAANTARGEKITANIRTDLYSNKYQFWGEKLLDQIHKEFYNKNNGLYAESIDAESQFVQATSFVWPASHMLRALKNAWKLNPAKYGASFYSYLDAIDLYKTTTSGRTGYAVLPGNNGTRFYDDNGQLVMPFCGIYDLTQDNATLNKMKIAYEFNNGIRDAQFAIPQHEDQLGNGMLFSMSVNYTSYAAAKLYQVTNETRYLEEALAYYELENDLSVKIKDSGTKLFNQASYFQNGTWSLNGIVNGETLRGGGYRAYQTTVVIQNAILLYQITNEQKYLDDAYEMMNSCINMWYKPGLGLSEISFWGGDDMIDALLDMYRETSEVQFFTIAADIMDFLSANNRDIRGYYSGSYDDSTGKWNLYRSMRNPSQVDLMGQAAAASSFLNVAFDSENSTTHVKTLVTDENKTNIRVYPNPVSDNTILKISVPEAEGVSCETSLYNQSGQQIEYFGSTWIAAGEQIVIRPKIKTPGVYFLRVKTNKNYYQTKVLVN